MTVGSLVLALMALGAVSLGVLTAVGATRRGAPAVLAVVAGLLFPVTWVVWYVRDERPWTATSAPRGRTP